MISNRLISAATIMTILATATSCGPGDAKFRFVFKELSIQLEAPKSSGDSNEARAMSTNCQSIQGLQVDIGLIKDGESKMQSTPRHLHIDPAQGGWLLESSSSVDPNGVPAISLRLRGSRPQELRFAPGNYRLAVTGFGNCITANNPSKKLPLVFFGSTRSFTPGQEIAIQANAKFSTAGLEPRTNTSLTAQPSPGFAYLALGLSSPSGGPWTMYSMEFRSTTSPTLADNWPKPGVPLGNPTHLGPIPSFGRYFVRVIWSNISQNTYQATCGFYDSTTLAAGGYPATIIQISNNPPPCPSAGTPLGQDAGNVP